MDGIVYWFTGLSGSGKSTLCRRFVDHCRSEGRNVVLLDGDELREALGRTEGHGRAARLALGMRYSRICALLSSQGFDVAIATISMFRELHDWNRRHFRGYVEIFLDVPMTELHRRDPKGIYSRASRGELKDVAGVDLKVDVPDSPHIRLLWKEDSGVDQAFQDLLHALKGLASS